MIDFTKVGKKISKYRKQINLSQEELADRLFVTRQALSKWENGTSAPSTDTLLELCNFFNVSFEDLLCLNDNEKIEVDPNDIFKGYNREFIINQIIKNELIVNLSDVFYQMSPVERLTILKAIKEEKIKCDLQELVFKLTPSEQRFLLGGQLYELAFIQKK
ncbi:MAG: helix-turn-helix domain-containing protein [Bacillales bacterium]|nr:helix-turn-helix domain-containing protein [Bacillales bacterium]